MGGDQVAEAITGVGKSQLRRLGLLGRRQGRHEHAPILAAHYLNKNPGLDSVLRALAMFRRQMAGTSPRSAFSKPPWKVWSASWDVCTVTATMSKNSEPLYGTDIVCKHYKYMITCVEIVWKYCLLLLYCSVVACKPSWQYRHLCGRLSVHALQCIVPSQSRPWPLVQAKKSPASFSQFVSWSASRVSLFWSNCWKRGLWRWKNVNGITPPVVDVPCLRWDEIRFCSSHLLFVFWVCFVSERFIVGKWHFLACAFYFDFVGLLCYVCC